MELRFPPLSGVEEVVEAGNLSLNSEFPVIAAFSDAADRRGRVHGVILMVYLGDLREGSWPNELITVVQAIMGLSSVRIEGLGANPACFIGMLPSEENINRLVDLAGTVEKQCNIMLRWVSGTNSCGLELMASGRMPRRINRARVGEAILLGHETVNRRPWPGTHQDAFVLHAEVLELKRKPSRPVGPRSKDAFGKLPTIEDWGERERALLNVGREDVDVDVDVDEDVDVEGIVPDDRRLTVLGGSRMGKVRKRGCRRPRSLHPETPSPLRERWLEVRLGAH